MAAISDSRGLPLRHQSGYTDARRNCSGRSDRLQLRGTPICGGLSTLSRLTSKGISGGVFDRSRFEQLPILDEHPSATPSNGWQGRLFFQAERPSVVDTEWSCVSGESDAWQRPVLPSGSSPAR